MLETLFFSPPSIASVHMYSVSTTKITDGWIVSLFPISNFYNLQRDPDLASQLVHTYKRVDDSKPSIKGKWAARKAGPA